MPLEKELETYHKALPELLVEEGKLVLIQDAEVAGTFDTYEEALQAGYDRFGLKPFMVKPIQAMERIQFVTRNVHPVFRT